MDLPDLGILEGYPRIRRFAGRLSDYIGLVRPFTLLGAWIAGFSLDILLSKPMIDLFHAFLVGFTLAFLQAGGQTFNQSIREEVEIDKLNGKQYRPTVDGRISLKQAKITSFILLLAGISLAFSLNINYGIFSFLIAFFAVAYTAPPFRMKKYFFISNLWQGIARGMLPALYVASVYGYGDLVFVYGICLALWVTGAQASKDFGDEKGDTEFGIQSFPVKLGRENALRLMGALMFTSFVCFPLFIMMGLLPFSFIALNILLIPSFLILYGLKKNIKLKYTENNLSWAFFYGTLGLFYIMPVFLI